MAEDANPVNERWREFVRPTRGPGIKREVDLGSSFAGEVDPRRWPLGESTSRVYIPVGWTSQHLYELTGVRVNICILYQDGGRYYRWTGEVTKVQSVIKTAALLRPSTLALAATKRSL